jgi:hypothetical protein
MLSFQSAHYLHTYDCAAGEEPGSSTAGASHTCFDGMPSLTGDKRGELLASGVTGADGRQPAAAGALLDVSRLASTMLAISSSSAHLRKSSMHATVSWLPITLPPPADGTVSWQHLLPRSRSTSAKSSRRLQK